MQQDINRLISQPITIIEFDHAINDPITMFELENCLNETKKTAPGPDDISYTIVKHCPPNILTYLLKIFNQILIVRTYPNIWRHSFILLFPKTNKDPYKKENLRPIALTCCMGKLMEKIISRRLMWLAEKQNFFNKYQCGFGCNLTTTDMITYIDTQFQNSLLKNEHTIAITLDLENAYNRVCKFKIFEQISEWGIGGNVVWFINNFISEPTFQVKINNVLSDTFILENGVRQRSVMSIFLFLTAMNGHHQRN